MQEGLHVGAAQRRRAVRRGRGASAAIPTVGPGAPMWCRTDSPTAGPPTRPDPASGQIVGGPPLSRLPQPGLGDGGERHGARCARTPSGPTHRRRTSLFRGDQRPPGVTGQSVEHPVEGQVRRPPVGCSHPGRSPAGDADRPPRPAGPLPWCGPGRPGNVAAGRARPAPPATSADPRRLICPPHPIGGSVNRQCVSSKPGADRGRGLDLMRVAVPAIGMSALPRARGDRAVAAAGNGRARGSPRNRSRSCRRVAVPMRRHNPTAGHPLPAATGHPAAVRTGRRAGSKEICSSSHTRSAGSCRTADPVAAIAVVSQPAARQIGRPSIRAPVRTPTAPGSSRPRPGTPGRSTTPADAPGPSILQPSGSR